MPRDCCQKVNWSNLLQLNEQESHWTYDVDELGNDYIDSCKEESEVNPLDKSWKMAWWRFLLWNPP